MRHRLARLARPVVCVCILLLAAPLFGADKQRKARETEAKRLVAAARNLEKQGHLIEARTQYLASEHVLFTPDAERGLQHVAEAADQQVKSLMASAAQAYAAENFAKASQLLASADALHPGSIGITCNLALTTYQLGDHRDEALTQLDQCVSALREKDPRRRLAELLTALETGDRHVVAPALKQQVASLNDAILLASDKDPDSDDDVPTGLAGQMPSLCAQMKQLQALQTVPAMLFNLAACAEAEGRFDEAVRLLSDYRDAAPDATDSEFVKARLGILKGLAALPEPQGALVRSLYTSASKRVDARRYDQAIVDYQKAAEALPSFVESTRRVATLYEAQGQMERARTYWQQAVLADTVEDTREQARLVVDGLDQEKGQYDELVNGARTLLHDLLGRSILTGEPVGRIYAASRLQLANEKLSSAELLLPLAPEGNLLRAFACSQVNDFRCVRASFDAQRSLTLPVSFYGAVFYKGVDPKKRPKEERTYGKFEFDAGTVRFAEISTVKPKRQTAQLATVAAGDDQLGRLGAADGLRSGRFQGFTVPARAVKKLETQGGILYLEIEDKAVKHRKMLIEPLNFVLEIPPGGPGSRRFMNNYITIAETYGGVERAKLGKESTTAGEKLKMVYGFASIGMSVTSVMFGDFTSAVDIVRGVNNIGHQIGLNQRQVRHLVAERRQAIQGNEFRAIPSEPVSLAFRKDLQ